jgi:hypothetical protein
MPSLRLSKARSLIKEETHEYRGRTIEVYAYAELYDRPLLDRWLWHRLTGKPTAKTYVGRHIRAEVERRGGGSKYVHDRINKYGNHQKPQTELNRHITHTLRKAQRWVDKDEELAAEAR